MLSKLSGASEHCLGNGRCVKIGRVRVSKWYGSIWCRVTWFVWGHINISRSLYTTHRRYLANMIFKSICHEVFIEECPTNKKAYHMGLQHHVIWSMYTRTITMKLACRDAQICRIIRHFQTTGSFCAVHADPGGINSRAFTAVCRSGLSPATETGGKLSLQWVTILRMPPVRRSAAL